MRLRIFTLNKGLQRHTKILENLMMDGMSSNESDSDHTEIGKSYNVLA
jgi:hypothetical protein